MYGALMILFISLIFSACHKSSNPGIDYIPKEANVVVSINVKQLHDKLKDGNFNVDSLMDNLKTQDSAFTLLPYLDLKVAPLVFVQYKSSVMSGKDILTGAVGKLNDRAGFEKQLASSYPGKSIVKKEDYSYLSLSDNNCYVWNNDILAIYGASNIVEKIPTLFKLKKDASLADDKNAIKTLNNNGDINFYSSSKDGLGNIPMLSMTKISDLIKGNYWGATLNFENGQVVLNGDCYYNKTVEDLIKKNPSKDVNKALLANYPGKPIGLFQISFNLKQIFSFLDYAGVTSMIEGYMKNLGITMDDLTNAFSGQVALAMQSTKGSSLDKGAPKMVGVIPIGDKSSFDKLMGALAKMGIFEQVGGQWVPQGMPADQSWSFHEDDNAIVFSSDKELSEKFQSGSEKLIYPKDLDYNDKTSVFYVDFTTLFEEISSFNNASDSATTAIAKETFENLEASASNINGNHSSINLVLHLKNKSKNSLPLIISTFDQINKIEKSQPSITVDSLSRFTPPVIVPDVKSDTE